MNANGIDSSTAAQMLTQTIGMTRDQLAVFFVAHCMHATGDSLIDESGHGELVPNEDLWFRKMRVYTGLPLKRIEKAMDGLRGKLPE